MLPLAPKISPSDVAPMFAGTMIGVTLTFANVGGFLTPILTGFITDGNVNQLQPVPKPNVAEFDPPLQLFYAS